MGEGEAFGGDWSGPQFVLTHHPPDGPTRGITFVDNLSGAPDLARDAAGDKYVNVLGASVDAQCLAAGALDEGLVSRGVTVRCYDVIPNTLMVRVLTKWVE